MHLSSISWHRLPSFIPNETRRRDPMGRPRIYADAAQRQRAFHARRREELQALRQKAARRPRHDKDVYQTPPEFAQAGLERVTVDPLRIVDVGAGDGIWGRLARERWPSAYLIGVELRDVP